MTCPKTSPPPASASCSGASQQERSWPCRSQDPSKQVASLAWLAKEFLCIFLQSHPFLQLHVPTLAASRKPGHAQTGRAHTQSCCDKVGGTRVCELPEGRIMGSPCKTSPGHAPSLLGTRGSSERSRTCVLAPPLLAREAWAFCLLTCKVKPQAHEAGPQG